MAAARLVLTQAYHERIDELPVEPPLNPYHPNQRKTVPKTIEETECGLYFGTFPFATGSFLLPNQSE